MKKILNKLQNLRNNFLFIILFYLIYSIFYRLLLLVKLNSLYIFKKKLFFNKKSCSTCFIMGSGSSINDITKDQFSFIKKNYSIGINSWFLHTFKTNIYMFEAGDPSWSEASKIFKYLEKNYAEYRKIPILMPYDSFWFDKKIKHLRKTNKLKIYYYFVLPFLITNKIFLSKAYKAKLKLSQFINLDSSIYGSGSSVIRAVCLAEELGYKNIVLLGVDLNNTDYFYNVDNSFLNKKDILDYENNQKGNVHLTNDPKSKKIIIEDFLKFAIEDKNFSSKIYITTKKSSLYPAIGLFDWSKS